MPDIPDKVIEQATLRLDRAAHQQTCAVHGYSGEPMRDPEGDVMWSLKAGVLAAVPVIAAWARNQEREKWVARIEAEAKERDLTRRSSTVDATRQAEGHATAVLRSLLNDSEGADHE